MASADTHSGVGYWLSIPAKDLSLWLELMNELVKEREKLIRKSREHH